jgi:hypothetical protein
MLRDETPLLISSESNVPPALASNHVQQRRPDWCWAACLEMLLRILRNTQEPQCQIVMSETGKTGCCNVARLACVTESETFDPHECDSGRTADKIDALFVARGIAFERVETSLSPSELDAQLATRPVQVWVETETGTQHVVLVIAKLDDDLYAVSDPCHAQPLTMSHAALLEHRGEWKRTWRNLV